MAGALEDFSRRPLQYKVIVFAGIGLLLGLLYWQFMLSPLRKERDASQADLDAQKAESARLTQQKKDYDDLVRREGKLRDDVEQNQKALPTEAEIPAFLDMLSRKSNEAGVQLIKRDVRKDVLIDASPPAAPGAAPPPPGAPPPAGATTFIKVPVDVEVTGTYYQLKKFFSLLRPKLTQEEGGRAPAPGATEEKERIVTIESLTITDPKVSNNEIVLTARFVASTFRAQQPAPLPGAPPPAATPTPAPAPPAATGAAQPASMKAKTEAAMETSETRTQKASDAADTQGGR